MSEKYVYICSPLRGANIEKNIHLAKSYCRSAIFFNSNVTPVAPHIYFTQFLSEYNPIEREIGMNKALELLSKCDEVWVFGIDHPSPGMMLEIQKAKELNIPIFDGFKKIYTTEEKLCQTFSEA